MSLNYFRESVRGRNILLSVRTGGAVQQVWLSLHLTPQLRPPPPTLLRDLILSFRVGHSRPSPPLAASSWLCRHGFSNFRSAPGPGPDSQGETFLQSVPSGGDGRRAQDFMAGGRGNEDKLSIIHQTSPSPPAPRPVVSRKA